MTESEVHGSSGQGLVWGIKDSFLRYVGGIPDSLCELFAGAATHSPGRFRFPCTDRVDSYGGALAVTAYDGLLCVMIIDPEIRGKGEHRQLVVGTGDQRRTAVADLRRTAELGQSGVHSPVTYATTLTAAGCQWLGDVYPPGEVLDVVEIRSPS